MAAKPAAVDVEDVHNRVDFDMAMKRVTGNHVGFEVLSFKGVALTWKPEWIGQLGSALASNETCKTLELTECGLTDGALQQLAASLAVPSRCPKLQKLDLRGNPALTQVGETVAQGLRGLRPGLEVLLGDGLDATREGFVHDKKLVPGLTSWSFESLKVPGTQNDLYCPAEISGDGPKVQLKRGFQGANGTKYKCDLAAFEMYHQTGNLVLISLASDEKESEGVVV
jgi:hypothetical protein